MRRFFSFFRITAVVAVAALLGSCAVPKIPLPFIGGDDEKNVQGFVPLSSPGLSTTKDIRADVVKILMDKDDIETLRDKIKSLRQGSESNWTNKKTGNIFTVRAIEPKPGPGDGMSRKVVVWGREKSSASTVVMTYRYHY